MSPPLACVGETITFTLEDAADTGGAKLVPCSLSQPIAPAPQCRWTLTIPPDYPPPWPLLSGLGCFTTIDALAPGEYSCRFEVFTERECAPQPVPVGPATATAVGFELRAIRFMSDHGLMYDNNTDFEATGDPFDQLNPTMPDVSLIDADATDALSTLLSNGKYYPNGNFSGDQVPLVWSPMLTVWRKLTLEVDSMAFENQPS